MANPGWHVLRLDEVAPIRVAGVNWKPIRRTLDIEAFGTNAYVAGPGEDVVEEHTEERLGHEEIYVVVSGRATFTLDGEAHDAPAGTVVHLADPSVRRRARAEEAGTLVLAIGGKPGEAFQPSAWEWYFEAERFRPEMDTDGALALLAEGLERFPDNAGMLYSTACWQALAGRDDEALETLRRAEALDPRVREWAATDDDLASIRERLTDDA
jgi:mannose-6-phosphate isomerase-like protein (cupin superfamily)